MASVTYIEMGDILFQQGKYEIALPYQHEAVRLCEKSGNISFLAEMIQRLGLTYGMLGRREEAARYLKDAVARQLQKMIEQNPLRTDYHARFMEIIAAYNKETDRATIEKTFELLVDLVRDLDHEEQRAVREGLTEEHLAVFDLLCRKKESLDPRSRERVKNIAAELLGRAAEYAVPGTLSMAVRLVSFLAPYNLIVTNVPGPDVPLYLLGARMVAAFPLVPLFERRGHG